MAAAIIASYVAFGLLYCFRCFCFCALFAVFRGLPPLAIATRPRNLSALKDRAHLAFVEANSRMDRCVAVACCPLVVPRSWVDERGY
jgi:hypothetical protein